MGTGISERAPRDRGRAQGGGHALQACGPLVQPPHVFSGPKILKYFKKIIPSFQGVLELLFSGHFSIARINRKTQK